MEISDILGRFKYRFSYGQNMIQHTLEETRIGLKLAYEVGADPNIVRLGCLLHDIGKVIDEEEGTHVELGVEFLKKYRDEIPVEYIQIDAGYTMEKLYEWEKWNGRFPHGPKWLVERIKEKGLKAGLWLVPFLNFWT